MTGLTWRLRDSVCRGQHEHSLSYLRPLPVCRLSFQAHLSALGPHCDSPCLTLFVCSCGFCFCLLLIKQIVMSLSVDIRNQNKFNKKNKDYFSCCQRSVVAGSSLRSVREYKLAIRFQTVSPENMYTSERD